MDILKKIGYASSTKIDGALGLHYFMHYFICHFIACTLTSKEMLCGTCSLLVSSFPKWHALLFLYAELVSWSWLSYLSSLLPQPYFLGSENSRLVLFPTAWNSSNVNLILSDPHTVIDPLLVMSTCLLHVPNPQKVDTVRVESGNKGLKGITQNDIAV